MGQRGDVSESKRSNPIKGNAKKTGVPVKRVMDALANQKGEGSRLGRGEGGETRTGKRRGSYQKRGTSKRHPLCRKKKEKKTQQREEGAKGKGGKDFVTWTAPKGVGKRGALGGERGEFMEQRIKSCTRQKAHGRGGRPKKGGSMSKEKVKH